MSKSSKAVIVLAGSLFLFTQLPLSAAVNSFTISVPQRIAVDTAPTNANNFPIMKMKVTVSVDSENPVTFRITDPQTPASQQTIGPLQPIANPGMNPSPLTFFPRTDGLTADSVRIFSPDNALPAGDPGRTQYVFVFDLSSDFNAGNFCAGKMQATSESWTITVQAGPQITGVCAQSLSRSIPGAQCTTSALQPVPLTGPIASVGGLPNSSLGCRPGVDVMMVLDKSGSMAGQTMNPDPLKNILKIDALHNAVTGMVNTWEGLRVNEANNTTATPPITSPDDQVGVVIFDSTAQFWTPGQLAAGLKSFETVRGDIVGNVNGIQPGTSTSIGDGLLKAANAFSGISDGKRHVILLMSDGMQNTDPMVGVNSAANPTQILTYSMSTPNVTTPLPNQASLQVYTVTVGTSTAVNASVNQDIARAGRGFYINTEDDASQMTPFFQQTLQNFLKFNTHEIVRMISDNVIPGTAYVPPKGFPVSGTTQSLLFNLTWNRQQASIMRLTITPPGGGAPIVRTSEGGSLMFNLTLPLPPPYDPTGDWQIQIDALRTAGNGVPFNFIVLADDIGIKSNLGVVSSDYAPTEKIKLQVNVGELGDLITGIGSGPGNQVIATLVKPGASIGDLLSASSAPSSPPVPGDNDAPADNKLQNTLNSNPSALVRATDTVNLFDDGKPEHGDATAGDGIYSALYPAQLPGHYNFLFAVEGKGKNVGRFSRMQLKTVYVRSVPDGNNTVFQTSVASNTYSIVMTPKTKAGDHMGPGWANYFWFTANGQTPFKAKDNLDGTYTATLNFTGNRPQVSVHFLRVSMIIGDAVTPDHLPVALDTSNVFVPDVEGEKHCLGKKVSAQAVLFLGAGMFLIGLLAYWPSRRRRQPWF